MEVTDETDGDVPGNPEDAILREVSSAASNTASIIGLNTATS